MGHSTLNVDLDHNFKQIKNTLDKQIRVWRDITTLEKKIQGRIIPRRLGGMRHPIKPPLWKERRRQILFHMVHLQPPYRKYNARKEHSIMNKNMGPARTRGKTQLHVKKYPTTWACTKQKCVSLVLLDEIISVSFQCIWFIRHREMLERSQLDTRLHCTCSLLLFLKVFGLWTVDML